MDTSKLSEYLLIWMAVMGLVALVRWRRRMPSAGLTLAYLLNLSLIHWIGAAVYVLPAFQNQDLRLTELGLEQSLYGLLAFAFGGLILTPILASRGWLPRSKAAHQPDPRLPKAYMACGVAFYLLLTSTSLGHLPTATAIVSSGQQLIVAGLALCCWKAWRENQVRRLIGWLLLAFLLPVTTLVRAGALGAGAIALLTLLIFVSGFVRSPFKIALVALPLLYLGLSVFVTYMRDRTDIRVTVWGGQSLSDRLDRLSETVATFEWFDPANFHHLQRIDARLNQNWLVGAAVNRLHETDGYARGDTLWDALLALIPRALWPDKPILAGSGDLVNRYTDIKFAPGTSVGIGQVLEFYANFGTTGVVIGFAIMGLVITVLDYQAADRLARSDLQGFVLWLLPGIALLQVNGQLVELTASAAASLVVALLTNKYLDRLQKRDVGGAPFEPTGVPFGHAGTSVDGSLINGPQQII
ncbi:MAG: hypothetical protein ABSH32_12090 [Bryobacteraceae bacterium]